MRLDIVIPAHNEEQRIDPTLTAYRRCLGDPETRFVVALDACTDGTAAIVRRHAAEDSRVAWAEYPKLGKGGVIAAAFAASDADLVAFVDADGATPPAELLRLVAATRHADGAIASRRHGTAVLPVPRPLRRRVASVGFAASVRALLGLRYRDTQCGAKVLRRDAALRALDRTRTTDLSFDVDLLLAAEALGLRIVEVPTVWIDRDGSRVDVAKDTRRMGRSLLRLWARHRLAGGRGRGGAPFVRTPASVPSGRAAGEAPQTAEREVVRAA